MSLRAPSLRQLSDFDGLVQHLIHVQLSDFLFEEGRIDTKDLLHNARSCFPRKFQ